MDYFYMKIVTFHKFTAKNAARVKTKDAVTIPFPSEGVGVGVSLLATAKKVNEKRLFFPTYCNCHYHNMR